MITILLSTYNGEKYLEEQLNSLIKQEGVEVSIFVRDDGSKDNTHAILNRWQDNGLLSWYTGKNLGAARSFFDLLQKAPDSEYYAFCDQDDVWLPNKLQRALSYLSVTDSDIPNLYGAGYLLVDANLNIMKKVTKPYLSFNTAGSVMLESHTPGCTMVFNRALAKEVKKHIPECFVFHDRWVLLVAYLLGNIHYDHFASLMYRQHENNVVGASQNVTVLDRLKHLITLPKRKLSPLYLLSSELLEAYKCTISEDKQEVLVICSIYNKSLTALMQLAFAPKFNLSPRGLKNALYWKCKILLRKI